MQVNCRPFFRPVKQCLEWRPLLPLEGPFASAGGWPAAATPPPHRSRRRHLRRPSPPTRVFACHRPFFDLPALPSTQTQFYLFFSTDSRCPSIAQVYGQGSLKLSCISRDRIQGQGVAITFASHTSFSLCNKPNII